MSRSFISQLVIALARTSPAFTPTARAAQQETAKGGPRPVASGSATDEPDVTRFDLALLAEVKHLASVTEEMTQDRAVLARLLAESADTIRQSQHQLRIYHETLDEIIEEWTRVRDALDLQMWSHAPHSGGGEDEPGDPPTGTHRDT